MFDPSSAQLAPREGERHAPKDRSRSKSEPQPFGAASSEMLSGAIAEASSMPANIPFVERAQAEIDRRQEGESLKQSVLPGGQHFQLLSDYIGASVDTFAAGPQTDASEKESSNESAAPQGQTQSAQGGAIMRSASSGFSHFGGSGYTLATGSDSASLDPSTVARSGKEGSVGQLPYLSQLEQSFGRSLGHINCHSGEKAQSAAGALRAHAYAHEGSVVVGDRSDLRTIAEETAHVLQMEGTRGSGGPAGGITDPGSAVEMEAGRAADTVASGGTVGHLSEGLGAQAVARSEAPESGPEPNLQEMEEESFAQKAWGWVKRNKKTIIKAAISTGLTVALTMATGGAGLIAVGIGAGVGAAVEAVDAGLIEKKGPIGTVKAAAKGALIGGAASGLAVGMEHAVAALGNLAIGGASQAAGHGATEAAGHGAAEAAGHGTAEAVVHGAAKTAEVGTHFAGDVGGEVIAHKAEHAAKEREKVKAKEAAAKAQAQAIAAAQAEAALAAEEAAAKAEAKKRYDDMKRAMGVGRSPAPGAALRGGSIPSSINSQ